MRTITVEAPAKVNLALDILRRREDGYHDLDMVMQSISLCDRVSVEEVGGGFALRIEGAADDFLQSGRKTLEQRAAEAFFNAIGETAPGLRVTLFKQIPAYAGLGGGSADVAALLRGLRELYCPELSTARLEEIGFQIGSDMPFCVRGGTARAQGRGERLEDLDPLPDCWIVLCKPDFDLPTPALFGRIRVDALKHHPDLGAMRSALEQGDLRGVTANLGNVFEEVLLRSEAEPIRGIRQELLRCGALNAAMSGSGPTVFGIFDRENAAQEAVQRLKKQYSQVFFAQPLKKFE